MYLHRRGIAELNNRQVDPRRNRHDFTDVLVATFAQLDEHFAGVHDDVGVRKNSRPGDYHARTRSL